MERDADARAVCASGVVADVHHEVVPVIELDEERVAEGTAPNDFHQRDGQRAPAIDSHVEDLTSTSVSWPAGQR